MLVASVVFIGLTIGCLHASIPPEPTPTSFNDHGGDFIFFYVSVIAPYLSRPHSLCLTNRSKIPFTQQ